MFVNNLCYASFLHLGGSNKDRVRLEDVSAITLTRVSQSSVNAGYIEDKSLAGLSIVIDLASPKRSWRGLHSKFNVGITHEYSIKI